MSVLQGLKQCVYIPVHITSLQDTNVHVSLGMETRVRRLYMLLVTGGQITAPSSSVWQ